MKLTKIKIKNCDSKNNLNNLIEIIYKLYGDLSGNLYSYTYNEKTKWLYSLNDYYTAFEINENYYSYCSLYLDENFRLRNVDYGDFFTYLNRNNELYITRKEDNIAHYMEFHNRIMDYLQVNKKTNENLLMAYYCPYSIVPPILKENIPNAEFITFFNKDEVKEYTRFVFEEGEMDYNIITIKEFGLLEFMKKGAFVLQKDKKIDRYFKVLKVFKNAKCMTLHPLTQPYIIEEMKEKIEEKGFSIEIPNYVLDYYSNRIYFERKELESLAEAIKSRNKTKVYRK